MLARSEHSRSTSSLPKLRSWLRPRGHGAGEGFPLALRRCQPAELTTEQKTKHQQSLCARQSRPSLFDSLALSNRAWSSCWSSRQPALAEQCSFAEMHMPLSKRTLQCEASLRYHWLCARPASPTHEDTNTSLPNNSCLHADTWDARGSCGRRTGRGIAGHGCRCSKCGH